MRGHVMVSSLWVSLEKQPTSYSELLKCIWSCQRHKVNIYPGPQKLFLTLGLWTVCIDIKGVEHTAGSFRAILSTPKEDLVIDYVWVSIPHAWYWWVMGLTGKGKHKDTALKICTKNECFEDLRVILVHEPCTSSLYGSNSNFSMCAAKVHTKTFL